MVDESLRSRWSADRRYIEVIAQRIQASSRDAQPSHHSPGAASAAGESTPNGTGNAKAARVSVPDGGSLTISTDTPGMATDKNGRLVRIAPHLAKEALAKATASPAAVVVHHADISEERLPSFLAQQKTQMGPDGDGERRAGLGTRCPG